MSKNEGKQNILLLQYGKQGLNSDVSKLVTSKGRDAYPSNGQRHQFYEKDLSIIPS